MLQDYLQGKLMGHAQADGQLAHLAALQHLGRASKSPPSEYVSMAPTPPVMPLPIQHQLKGLSSAHHPHSLLQSLSI